jgi:putative oxidoreductase
MAFEECVTEAPLERADSPVNRGGVDAESLGGARQAGAASSGKQQLQLAPLQFGGLLNLCTHAILLCIHAHFLATVHGYSFAMNTSTLASPSLPDSSTTTTWLQSLLATDASIAPLLSRVSLALVMLPHGAQKLLGWFGGFGFEGTMAFFTEVVGLPWLLALTVILLESLGALALLLGLATRVMAAGLGAIMIGAIATSHAKFGFFMNWFGAQQGEGFEYHLLALGLAASLLVTGGGRASLDARLARG